MLCFTKPISLLLQVLGKQRLMTHPEWTTWLYIRNSVLKGSRLSCQGWEVTRKEKLDFCLRKHETGHSKDHGPLRRLCPAWGPDHDSVRCPWEPWSLYMNREETPLPTPFFQTQEQICKVKVRLTSGVGRRVSVTSMRGKRAHRTRYRMSSASKNQVVSLLRPLRCNKN